MKKFALMAAVAAASMMALPAVAHAEWYAGAGYTQFETDDAEVGAATGRLGYRFNPNFAVEGEGSIGVDDDDGAELDGAYGAYAVGVLPIGTSGFEVLGRAGYQELEIDGTTVDEGGFSYGAGVGWRLGSGFGLRADYTRTEADDDDVDAISLGGTVNF